MKLRLKIASTGAAHRLDLPSECNWQRLQAECRRVLGLAPDAELQLSLNKKVPLSAKLDAPVTSLGLCSGDLLWLLSSDPQVANTAGASPAMAPPALAAANPGSPASYVCHAPPQAVTGAAQQTSTGHPPQSARTAVPSGAVANGPGASTPTGTTAIATGSEGTGGCGLRAPKRAADQAGTDCGAKREGDASGAAACTSNGRSGAGDAMEVDAGAATAAAGAGEVGGGDDGLAADCGEDEPAATDVDMGPPGVSLRLRRLLTPSAAPTCDSAAAAAAAASPCGPASTVAHSTAAAATAAATDAGGAAPWFRLAPAARALLLLDCAMAEAGLRGMQDLPGLALASIEKGGGGDALPRRLLYGCPYITDGGAAGAASATGAAAAAEEGRQRSAGGDVSMAEAAAGGGRDGSGAAVAGPSGPSDEQQHRQAPVVKLMWYGMGPSYLVVHGTTCAAAAAAGGAVTLHVDLSEYGSGRGGGVEAAKVSGGGAAPPGRVVGGAGWRRLKDGLALPLLAAACRTAGLAPPLGLQVLPLELQLAVLSRLQPRELAALSCTCTPLHALASEDVLWRPLYEAEFGGGPGGPSAPPGDLAFANSRGYKALFARRWRERAEMRRRRQTFRPMPPPPTWGPPPLAPFFRPPFMPPGSIGGDYDRLPPPLLLGGGPGGVYGGPRGGFFSGGGLPGGLPGLPGPPRGGPGPGLGPGPRPGWPWGGSGGGFFGGGGGFM